MFVRFGNIDKEGFIGRIKMTDSNDGDSTDAMYCTFWWMVGRSRIHEGTNRTRGYCAVPGVRWMLKAEATDSCLLYSADMQGKNCEIGVIAGIILGDVFIGKVAITEEHHYTRPLLT
jgi:hypothetical protein